MASASLKDLTKAPTLTPPIDSHALSEHSRNNREKCDLSGNSIECRSKFVTNNQQNETVESTGAIIYEINHYCIISAGSKSRNTQP